MFGKGVAQGDKFFHTRLVVLLLQTIEGGEALIEKGEALRVSLGALCGLLDVLFKVGKFDSATLCAINFAAKVDLLVLNLHTSQA